MSADPDHGAAVRRHLEDLEGIKYTLKVNIRVNIPSKVYLKDLEGVKYPVYCKVAILQKLV